MATDLALHFRDMPALTSLAEKVNRNEDLFDEIVMNCTENKKLLQAGLMTAADLGAATKSWEVHEHVSQLIAEEFWTQGDIERSEFSIDPQPMFDRSVPLETVQIEYLDNTCMPLYKNMSGISVELEPLLEGCKANRCKWAKLQSSASNNVPESPKMQHNDQARKL